MDIYKLVVIILLILVFTVIYLYFKLKEEYKTKCLDLNFWKNKYREHHQKLLIFIQEIQIYLNKYNIKYWAHAGTLLGFVRHQGFIPWDDDVDFGYLNEKDSIGKDLILNMLDELKSNGYKIEKYFFGYKILSPYDKKIFIDLFEFNIKNNQAIQTEESINEWPKENYNLEELFPLKIDNFENIILPVPNKPINFCLRAYGENFMEIFYLQCHFDTFLYNIKDGIGIFSLKGTKFYINDLK